jgi:hypothetical protein
MTTAAQQIGHDRFGAESMAALQRAQARLMRRSQQSRRTNRPSLTAQQRRRKRNTPGSNNNCQAESIEQRSATPIREVARQPSPRGEQVRGNDQFCQQMPQSSGVGTNKSQQMCPTPMGPAGYYQAPMPQQGSFRQPVRGPGFFKAPSPQQSGFTVPSHGYKGPSFTHLQGGFNTSPMGHHSRQVEYVQKWLESTPDNYADRNDGNDGVDHNDW